MPVVLAVPLADVIAAVCILLLVWGASILLVKPLVMLLSWIPVVGQFMADRLTNLVDGVVSWATDWAKTAVGAFVQLIAVPVGAIIGAVSNIVATIEAAGAAIIALVAGAVTFTARIALAFRLIASNVAQLVASIAAGVAHAIAVAASAAATLVNAARVALTAAIAAVHAALTAAIAAETALINAVKGNLLAFIAGQVAVITAAWTAAITAVRTTVATDVKGIEAEIAHVNALVLPLVAAAVIPRIIALEQTTTREFTQCLDPMCNVIGPTLAGLSALADIATLLAVGGLVGEAIADPEGTAKGVASVIGGIESAANGLFGAFTGAQAHG